MKRGVASKLNRLLIYHNVIFDRSKAFVSKRHLVNSFYVHYKIFYKPESELKGC